MYIMVLGDGTWNYLDESKIVQIPFIVANEDISDYIKKHPNLNTSLRFREDEAGVIIINKDNDSKLMIEGIR